MTVEDLIAVLQLTPPTWPVKIYAGAWMGDIAGVAVDHDNELVELDQD